MTYFLKATRKEQPIKKNCLRTGVEVSKGRRVVSTAHQQPGRQGVCSAPRCRQRSPAAGGRSAVKRVDLSIRGRPDVRVIFDQVARGV